MCRGQQTERGLLAVWSPGDFLPVAMLRLAHVVLSGPHPQRRARNPNRRDRGREELRDRFRGNPLRGKQTALQENIMAILEQTAFDEDGFMRDPQQWTADIAKAIAESLGLEGLGYAQVRVIEFLREHYLAKGAVPPAEEICHAIDLEKHCIRELFKNYEKAWKVAGLPNPGMQLREYMEDAG
jgi:tRNA 2-thiouridine synthesizing protein E